MLDTLRSGLPEPTVRIAALPVYRGYPVPWFVGWLDADGKEVVRGEGTPDFRVLASGCVAVAHTTQLCFICGARLGAHKAFPVGPMCTVNRTSAEPPSHVDCAEWAVQACPFLTNPVMRRREKGMPEEAVEVPGIMLDRNPGVTAIWIVKTYGLRRAHNGVLFDIGEPVRVEWWAEGRKATRDEVLASMESGMPFLEDLATAQGLRAKSMLGKMHAKALEYLPS